MALTLVVEDGTAKSDANTYISLNDAETYMEGRLHTTTWDGETDANKNAALVQATRILDRYVNWLGYKSDQDQALAWPRWGICYDCAQYYECAAEWYGNDPYLTFSVASDTIPQEIKDAACELALYLLGTDPQAVPDTAGFSEIEVEGAIRLKIDKRDRASTIPGHVWDMVRHLGSRKGGANVRLMRG
jgi:hypothetical protein